MGRKRKKKFLPNRRDMLQSPPESKKSKTKCHQLTTGMMKLPKRKKIVIQKRSEMAEVEIEDVEDEVVETSEVAEVDIFFYFKRSK